jgi:hypothetical protein
MKKLALLLAVIFCVGSMAMAKMAIPTKSASPETKGVKKVMKVKKVSHKKKIVKSKAPVAPVKP